MFRGDPAPYAMLLKAVWLGTLLRVGQAEVYTNDWAIKISADEETAMRIAEKHGFANLGQVGDRGQRGRLSRSLTRSPQTSDGSVAAWRSWSWKQN